MATTRIDLPELQRLLGAGAQLVDVLPAAGYTEQHLPGAISIPLKTLDPASTDPRLQDTIRGTG